MDKDWTAAFAIPVGLASSSSGNPARPSSLTPVEFVVMRLSAIGLTIAEVAYALGVTYHTARNHRRAVYAKLGVSNVSGAVWALGWVRLPDHA